jgi:transcriptional regulator with AAA-type ATPase domain
MEFTAMAPLGQNLDNFLDEFSRLSLEDQEMLLDLLKKRNIEQKRMRIVREVKEAQREYKKGLTKRGKVEDLMRDLESD